MIQRMLKRKVWFGGSISAVTPASQWRRQKISMILQIAPLTNQISVLGGIVVPCNSRCRVPQEMSGHGKGRVESIPKADKGIDERVSQILLKMSGKFVQSFFGK